MAATASSGSSGTGTATTAAASGNVSGVQRVVGFAVVALVLFMAADFPTTSELAVAFAYLIMLSALIAAGPAAFGRISSLVT